MIATANQIHLDAQAIDSGRDHADIIDLSDYTDDQIKAWAEDTELLSDSFGYSPLSGEWAGESIPEIFGYTPDGDTLDRYEGLAVEWFHSQLQQRVTELHWTNTTATVTTYNANMLAHLAGCASPDSPYSAGAEYLLAVRNNVVEAYRYSIDHGNTFDREEDLHEAVDSAVPIYSTHHLWSAFVDLAAYQTDIADMLPSLDDHPGVALYTVGMALAEALCDEMGI
jgi:hypothetical protein